MTLKYFHVTPKWLQCEHLLKAGQQAESGSEALQWQNFDSVEEMSLCGRER
jgi:hypothetical protein